MSYTFGRSNSEQNSIDTRNWPPAIISNSLCTPEPLHVRKVNEFYEHVEAHLNGVARVLKPMLEINNIFEECRRCKSDNHNVRGKLNKSDTKISYYTPQRLKYDNTLSSGDQRQYCKCDENFTGKKSTSDHSYNRSASKSTFKPLSEASSSTTLSISKKANICSKVSSSRSFAQQEHVLKNCSMCGININKVKVLALVPCKHLFCYPCMSHTGLNACPKCSKPVKREAIRNITMK